MMLPPRLRDRAAQLLMVRMGSNVPPPTPAEDDADRVRQLLERCPVGGLILFRGRWPQTRETLHSMQAASETPLLVGADLERGLGQQVRGGTRFPHAMAAGQAPDPADAAATLARVTAREARAAGIHVLFAPVADADLHAVNPIIGPRAFHADPEVVAACVEAYIAAARSEGVLTCAKHFPGHGRTRSDSHETLPVVETPASVLRTIDLLPFRRAVAAGVDTVMTAHVAYPGLDPSGQPATASAPILIDLLRDEMGFEGCVVSDSLLMDGIRSGGDPGDQAVDLLRAGVDLLLDPQAPEAVVNGIVRAVEADTLPEARLDEAVRRVVALKERMFGEDAVQVTEASAGDPAGDSAASPVIVGSPAHQRAAAACAREGLRVLWAERPDRENRDRRTDDGGDIFVIGVSRRESRLSGSDGEADATADERLVDALRRRLEAASYRGAVQFEAATARSSPADVHVLGQLAASARVVIAAVVAEPAAWQSFGVPDALLDPVAQMLTAAVRDNRKAVLVVLGSPHVGDQVESTLRASVDGASLRDSRFGWSRIDAFSNEPVSQQAVAEALARWISGDSDGDGANGGEHPE